MEKEPKRSSNVQFLRIQNSYSRPVTIHLEPWGEELMISPNATYEFAARGPDRDFLQIDFAPSRITIYGWSGSVISVYYQGKLLRTCEVAVPAVPERPTEP